MDAIRDLERRRKQENRATARVQQRLEVLLHNATRLYDKEYDEMTMEQLAALEAAIIELKRAAGKE
jgi:hypothetical protein